MNRAAYFAHLSVVEIQQTFYHPPELATAERWRREAPSGFIFTLKAWQLITHVPASPTYRRLRMAIPAEKKDRYGAFRSTDEVFAAWERTAEIAAALHARVIVFQSPASFHPTRENEENMRRFFSAIDRKGYRLAWEPRGEWRAQDIKSLCRELELIDAVDPFQTSPTWGNIRYYRLHGIGGYRYKYSGEELARLKALAEEETDTFFMFNNSYMHEDALAFARLVGEE